MNDGVPTTNPQVTFTRHVWDNKRFQVEYSIFWPYRYRCGVERGRLIYR
jgi:hypothetical protein